MKNSKLRPSKPTFPPESHSALHRKESRSQTQSAGGNLEGFSQHSGDLQPWSCWCGRSRADADDLLSGDADAIDGENTGSITPPGCHWENYSHPFAIFPSLGSFFLTVVNIQRLCIHTYIYMHTHACTYTHTLFFLLLLFKSRDWLLLKPQVQQ